MIKSITKTAYIIFLLLTTTGSSILKNKDSKFQRNSFEILFIFYIKIHDFKYKYCMNFNVK